MAFFVARYLQCRNDIYYFRRAFPLDIRQRSRQQECVICLRTSSKQHATNLLFPCLQIFDLLVKNARANNGMLDPNFKAIVQDFFKRSAISSIHNHQNALFAGKNMASVATLTEALAAHDAHLKNLDSYKSMTSGAITEIVDGLITDNPWLSTEIGQSDPTSARAFVQREFLKFMREVIGGALALHQDPSFTPETAAPLTVQIQPTNLNSPLFSAAWHEYVEEHSHNWKTNTQREYATAAAEFSSTEFATNKPIAEYTRQDLVSYRSALLRLPAQRNKLKAYRSKSVQELLQMDIPEVERLKGRTINERLTVLVAFFKWCHTIKDYMSKEITSAVLLKGVISKERAPFSETELKKIFDPKLYQREADTPFKFWLPLMGLYTGARISEIAQLMLSDLIVVDGIHTFRITDMSEDQDLKSESARRLVPIHARLIEAGILVYAEALRNRGECRLFPDLTLGKKSPGDPASKAFTRHRDKAGVPPEDELGKEWVFHSFRHTFVTRLRHHAAKHDVALLQQIVGHEKSLFGATAIYTHDFSITACKEVIDTLDSDAIDIASLTAAITLNKKAKRNGRQ